MVGLNAVMRRLRPIFVGLLIWEASEALHAADTDTAPVTELTIEQATEVASAQADLELSHLRTLSPQVADLLARSKHAIILNGLTSLSPESAAALAKHSQLLRMDGLETVSEEVAAALTHHDGAVYLLGIETLSDRAAGLLEANPRIHLPMRFRPPAPAGPPLAAAADAPPAIPSDRQSELTKALIAAGHPIEAGKLEIESRFHLARPMWNYDGLETLNEAWAEEATDAAEQARLKAALEFSPAWWQEMEYRYGIHPPAPESHQDFAVALGLLRTQANVAASSLPGLVTSCRLCHSTMLFTNPDPQNPEPRFAEGIPNAFLDFERFHQNVATSGGTSSGFLFAKNLPRFFTDSADFFGILVPVVRPDGIKPSLLRYDKFFAADHGSNYTKKIEGQVPLIPFLKPLPWTNYKYKTSGTEGQGLYVDGGFTGNVADVTYAMAISRDHLGADYAEAREVFRQCVPDYFKTLTTPRYPFIKDVSAEQADVGHAVFIETCARCHGDFKKTGPKAYELVSFPNTLVDPDELGTDPLRITGVFDMNAEQKKRFLSGSVTVTHKYVAPPLVGIWARGPYLHNASVPTVYNLLKSSTRPRKYSMRPSGTDPDNYDQARIGWKFVDESAKSHQQILEQMKREPYVRVFDPDWRSPEQWEQLRQALANVKNVKVDPTKPELYTGMLNTGHTFGDDLSEEQRLAVLEFLKCL